MLPRSLLLRAGLRQFLHHRWQLLLALTGIALGVAVVLAVDLANQGARASFELSAEAVSGKATHRISSPLGHFPDRHYVHLKTTQGHLPMAPMLEGRVRSIEPERTLRLIGIDVFAEHPFHRQGKAIALNRGQLTPWLIEAGRVVVTQKLAAVLRKGVGERFSVRRRGIEYPLTLHSIISTSKATEDVLIADLSTTQEVLGRVGELTSIDLILSEEDAQKLRSDLPAGLELKSVEQTLEGVQNLSATFELNLTAMSLLALLVGMFLIYNAMNLSLLQRRLLLGRLRAAGVTPRELFISIMQEAIVLALIGTLIGLVLGMFIGEGLMRLVAATVSELYYRVNVEAMGISGFSLFKTTLLGIGGTIAATALPAWRAAQTPPLTVLSRAALEQETRSRLWPAFLLGWLGVGSGLIVALLIPGGVILGFIGLFLVIIGVAAMTPMALIALQKALNRPWPALTWRLVIRNLERHLSRLGIAVAALAIALAAGVSVGTMVNSMRDGVTFWLHSVLNAPLYLATEDFADNAPIPSGLQQALRERPEIQGLSEYRHRYISLAGKRSTLVAVSLSAVSRQGFLLLDAEHSEAWARFDQGQILISEPLSTRLGIGQGDSVALPTPSGQKRFTVAATFRDYANEFGRVFMPREQYVDTWQDETVNSIAVLPADGVSTERLRTVTESVLENFPRVHVTAAEEVLNESLRVFDRTFRVTEALRLLAMIVAFVGVFSALMAMQLERRKEFAVLRALGLTRGQSGAMIALESSLLGLVAGILAIPLGLLMAWLLVESVQKRAFGWSMPFNVDATLLMQTLLIGVLAALLASLYPAWRSAHEPPAAQLRED